MSTDGRKPPFLVDYRIDGWEYSFHLNGPTSWADAERHVAAIAMTARVIGSDAVEIPANALTLPAVSIWVRLLCWWRNRARA